MTEEGSPRQAPPEGSTTVEPKLDERVPRPLVLKVALVMALMTATPPALLGAAFLGISKDQIKRETITRLNANAAITGVAVEDWIEASDLAMQQLAGALSDREVPQDRRLDNALTLFQASVLMDQVAIYQGNGELLDVITHKEVAPWKFAKRLGQKEREAAAKEGVSYGAHTEALGSSLRMMMVIPIKPGQEVTGYVAAPVKMDALHGHLTELSDDLELKAGGLQVINRRTRRLLLDLDAAESTSGRKIDHALLDEARQALKGNRTGHLGEYADAQGALQIGSVRPIDGVEWVVVASRRGDEVYAFLDQLQLGVLAVILLSVTLSLLVSFLFVRHLSAPIRKLVAFARDLAQRRFDQRVEVGTRDELSLLARTLSRAAADLEASEETIRREEAIRADLGRYLPREVVERVVAREQDMSLGGQRREITVIFADVVGFTPMTEDLGPEDVVAILNQLFTIMTEVVFRHGGTVDKFMGDCLMAFWGAPSEQPDHAEMALTAAEDMMRFLEVGNAGWEQQYGVSVRLAIGINTGPAVVGNVGSETRMAYTAIGDVVNVAARLEAVARPQQILITEDTRAAAGDLFEYVPFGTRKLTGTGGEVAVFEVVV